MFLTRISVNHPVFATMLMVALVVFGIYSFQRLPIEQMPNTDIPIVAVVVSYPGTSPQAVETDIVKPIEDAMSTISGLDKIQSTAQPGSAMVLIQFKLQVNSATAMQGVRDRLAGIEGSLPKAARKPEVFSYDPSSTPIISLAVSSSSRSLQELTTMARDRMVNRLRNVAGVGAVTLVGGVPSQIQVTVDPQRMEAYAVGMSDVMSAIAANNADLPAGSIKEGTTVQSIQVQGKIESIEGFSRIIVTRQGGQPVYLADVARVSEGVSEPISLAYLNGERALAIDVLKVQGANTVQVARDIQQIVANLSGDVLPQDVSVDVIANDATPVEESLSAVQNMLLEGAILSVVIVFLFLNSWRSTVITGLTLPIALIGTMVALNFLGYTLNIMTLMALSLSVGILIDDAIVVRENITRHLHMGKGHRRAALEGTKEIGLAVLATTLSIVAVFLPVAFMDGMMGRFFLQFGVTVSVAVMLSLFVAFTLDPMMSSVWYDPDAEPNAKRGPIGRTVQQFDRFFEWVASGYTAVLRWCLRHRVATLVATVALFAASFLLVPRVGVEFLPSQDNGTVRVELKTAIGSSLDYTAAKATQVEAMIRKLPEVERTYTTLSAGAAAAGANSASIEVRLVPQDHRTASAKDVTDSVRSLLAQVPGLSAVISSGDGFGAGGKPIQIIVQGQDLAVLQEIGEDVAARLAAIDGAVDVASSLRPAQPIVGIRIDPERASALGVTAQQISGALAPMLNGETVTKWTAPDGKTFDMIVRVDETARDRVASLNSLPIASGPGNAGGLIHLDQVADITRIEGPAEILRQGLDRRVTIDANLSSTAPPDVFAQISALTASLDLPEGYRLGTGGDAEDLAETGASTVSALLLAVIFIYLVLASQFGSFLQPLAIMVSLPLSLVGVIAGLLIGGSTLNMMSMIGFIMLMGLVVKNAILLVDNANQQVKDGINLFDALVTAGAVRFRPIVMTTLAMILGMLPLALNLHHGSSQNAPMAHAVIGGLISSTLLTLVVVPVILTYLDSFARIMARFMPKRPVDHDAGGDLPVHEA
jgi:HAE1 family hydrophobic/amphiphilic exporter-1